MSDLVRTARFCMNTYGLRGGMIITGGIQLNIIVFALVL
jgi:hypothetical protein